jgi:hypothetical protein
MSHRNRTSESEDFVALVTAFQRRPYGFVPGQRAAPDVAADTLQEKNIILWKRAEEVTLRTNFKAWASRIAHSRSWLTGCAGSWWCATSGKTPAAGRLRVAADAVSQILIRARQNLVSCAMRLASRPPETPPAAS